jgi:mRNA-degrading endonuclease RelE of RelBE toxin-antitoxin system
MPAAPNSKTAGMRQAFDRPINSLYSQSTRVELTPAAAEQLARLPRVIRTRATKVLERLERWPAVSGARPLIGDLSGKYRIRTGDYRLRFCLMGKTVVVERIGHRDGFYEK